MDDRIMYMELRELFERMNPLEAKQMVDRIALNKVKSPFELKTMADEAISELLYRASCYPSEHADACTESLSELADRIAEYASPEAIQKAYDIINQ